VAYLVKLWYDIPVMRKPCIPKTSAYDFFLEHADDSSTDSMKNRCLKLIKNVLLQAAWDLVHYKTAPTDALDAWQWFISPEKDLFLSFYSVCDLLNVGHEAAQENLKRQYGHLFRKKACMNCGDLIDRFRMEEAGDGFCLCHRCKRDIWIADLDEDRVT